MVKTYISTYQFGILSPTQRLWAKVPLHSTSTNLPLTSNDTLVSPDHSRQVILCLVIYMHAVSIIPYIYICIYILYIRYPFESRSSHLTTDWPNACLDLAQVNLTMGKSWAKIENKPVATDVDVLTLDLDQLVDVKEFPAKPSLVKSIQGFDLKPAPQEFLSSPPPVGDLANSITTSHGQRRGSLLDFGRGDFHGSQGPGIYLLVAACHVAPFSAIDVGSSCKFPIIVTRSGPPAKIFGAILSSTNIPICGILATSTSLCVELPFASIPPRRKERNHSSQRAARYTCWRKWIQYTIQ